MTEYLDTNDYLSRKSGSNFSATNQSFFFHPRNFLMISRLCLYIYLVSFLFCCSLRLSSRYAYFFFSINNVSFAHRIISSLDKPSPSFRTIT